MGQRIIISHMDKDCCYGLILPQDHPMCALLVLIRSEFERLEEQLAAGKYLTPSVRAVCSGLRITIQ